jgi:SAM-dependent methyltransferase
MEVTGVDMSGEMLCMAAQKAQGLGLRPRFVRQKLQNLRLPKAVDLAVCALDSLDYILDPEDCREAIRRVYKYLNPGGCFIFDVNTPEKLRAMDGQIFLDEDDDVYCVWRGEFDEQTNICTYGMDLFQRSGGVQNGVVFKHGGNQVLFALGGQLVHGSLQGPVVTFAAAAGKVDFAGLAAQGVGYLLAGFYQSKAGFTSLGINAAGVAIAFGQPGHHGVQHFFADGGGGGVVCIYITLVQIYSSQIKNGVFSVKVC